MAVRREVLGDEHVDRATANATPVTEDFQEFITRYAWGGVWTRAGLDRRSRSIVTLTALVAGRHFDELEFHLRAALRNGLTKRGDRRGAAADRGVLRRPRGELGVRRRRPGAHRPPTPHLTRSLFRRGVASCGAEAAEASHPAGLWMT